MGKATKGTAADVTETCDEGAVVDTTPKISLEEYLSGRAISRTYGAGFRAWCRVQGMAPKQTPSAWDAWRGQFEQSPA